MAIVHANGVDLQVNRYCSGPRGDRPTIVFIHGLTVDNSGWTFTLGMPLATDAEVVLYALRGHGRSEFVVSGYTVADHVADLVALLDVLGIDGPVHLVAASYGAAVGTLTAVEHPDRVASLFLLDGYPPVDGWVEHIAGPLEGADRALRGEYGEYTVEQVMEVLGERSARKAAAVAERIGRLLGETTLLADVRRERALGADELARVRCPVFGVYGADSDAYPLAQRFQALVPAARIQVIPDVDHLQVFAHTREIGVMIRRLVGLPAPEGEGDLVASTAGQH